MSKRTAEAGQAIRLAWQNEQELVLKGKGTRDWTPEQQKDITDKGKAYDDNGRAFEGHHMMSAEKNPDYQGEPNNIQFLTRSEHLAAHHGFFQNPTNGYYNPTTGETKDFGLNKYEPCEIIELSNPVLIISGKMQSLNDGTAKSVNDDNNTDVCISSAKNVSDNVRNIDAEKLTTNISKQSSYTVQPISIQNSGGFKKFIGVAENLIGKAVNYAIQNPGKVIKGLVAIAVFGEKVVSATKSSGGGNSSSNNSDYTPSIDANLSNNYYKEDGFSSEDYDKNYNISDDRVETSKRSSPIPHIVHSHKQRYGKNKEWRVKAPYPRGDK